MGSETSSEADKYSQGKRVSKPTNNRLKAKDKAKHQLLQASISGSQENLLDSNLSSPNNNNDSTNNNVDTTTALSEVPESNLHHAYPSRSIARGRGGSHTATDVPRPSTPPSTGDYDNDASITKTHTREPTQSVNLGNNNFGAPIGTNIINKQFSNSFGISPQTTMLSIERNNTLDTPVFNANAISDFSDFDNDDAILTNNNTLLNASAAFTLQPNNNHSNKSNSNNSNNSDNNNSKVNNNNNNNCKTNDRFELSMMRLDLTNECCLLLRRNFEDEPHFRTPQWWLTQLECGHIAGIIMKRIYMKKIIINNNINQFELFDTTKSNNENNNDNMKNTIKYKEQCQVIAALFWRKHEFISESSRKHHNNNGNNHSINGNNKNENENKIDSTIDNENNNNNDNNNDKEKDNNKRDTENGKKKRKHKNNENKNKNKKNCKSGNEIEKKKDEKMRGKNKINKISKIGTKPPSMEMISKSMSKTETYDEKNDLNVTDSDDADIDSSSETVSIDKTEMQNSSIQSVNITSKTSKEISSAIANHSRHDFTKQDFINYKNKKFQSINPFSNNNNNNNKMHLGHIESNASGNSTVNSTTVSNVSLMDELPFESKDSGNGTPNNKDNNNNNCIFLDFNDKVSINVGFDFSNRFDTNMGNELNYLHNNLKISNEDLNKNKNNLLKLEEFSNYFIHITDVCTDKEYRHKHIGSIIFSNLFRLYPKGTLFALEVRSDNRHAQKLYWKFGFEHVDTINKYYHDGCSAFKMVKIL